MLNWIISVRLEPFKCEQIELLVLNSHTQNHSTVCKQKIGGARGVMVIIIGNGHGDTSSNPGLDWLHFHIALIPLGKV